MKEIHPFWRLGFRPFFLFGGLSSFLLIFTWLLIITNNFELELAYSGYLWHTHEMIFGFSSAILAGFLLTASQNWSGIQGLYGSKLKFLFSIWLIARIIPFVLKSGIILSLIDLLFLPLLIYFLLPYLFIKAQKHNRIFILFIFQLFVANFMFHLEFNGIISGYYQKNIYLGLNTLLITIVFISGRIIPFFTKKAVEEAKVNKIPLLEKLTLISMYLYIISELFLIGKYFNIAICLACFLINFYRWLNWNPWQTRKKPVLWILYAGYFWLIIGFLLRGFEQIFLYSHSISTHAFTVGGIGIFIFGMITRVSLGHTGRKIEINKIITFSYYLLIISSLIRVFVPFLTKEYYQEILIISGLFWCIAFIIFIFSYFKILTKTRIDNKFG